MNDEQTATEGTVEMKLEVEIIPVSDVDRAKRFYQGLGWRLDADFSKVEEWHAVQLTPPGSACSIIFGKGVTTAAPGSAQGMFLVVDDIEAARADLIGRGVEVSDIWHIEPGKGRVEGVDPQRRSYFSRATFADPDGNTWTLQEITERLPGRVWQTSIAALAELLHETAEHHGAFEAVAPPHDWWDWYAAYMDARQRGSSSEEAAAAAGRYMADVKHVVV